MTYDQQIDVSSSVHLLRLQPMCDGDPVQDDVGGVVAEDVIWRESIIRDEEFALLLE